MTIDSEALRTFLTIARAGGFARASAHLHRSQPAISRRIAQLEGIVGAPLFERGAGGVALTSAGKALMPFAERALAALDDCAAAVANLAEGKTGEVRIAVVGTLANHRLAELLHSFRREYAGVRVVIRTATSREVSDLVRSGEAEIGLRYHKDRSADLFCEDAGEERLVVICANDHPLARRRSVRLSALSEETWLAFPNVGGDEPTAGSVFAHFLIQGVSGVPRLSIDSLTAQKRLVEAGVGLALVPRSAVEEERRAKMLTIMRVADIEAVNRVFVVRRRGAYQSVPATRLADLFRTGLCGDEWAR